MGYYLLPSTKSVHADAERAVVTDFDRWRDELENGTARQRLDALRKLITAQAENQLVRCLASANAAVTQLAVAGLWECWLSEEGDEARREIDTGTEAMNMGDLEGAAATFADLMARYPYWAEATNKLATARYLQNRPEESIELCRQVVAHKPDHFGAWNGLALCSIQIEDWPQALEAVRASLRLQPSSATNHQLLDLVQSRLPPA